MASMWTAQWFLLLLPLLVRGDCGSRRNTQARIVGGSVAPENSWPWQAMLRNVDGEQFCGGTLIDPLWVLTAAHCLPGENTTTFFVRMGAHNKENDDIGTEQDIDVAQIISHENYKTPLADSNDIALLKLASPVNITEKVGLACLPNSRNSLVNKTCWITGWGTLSSGGNQPNVLMQASVPLVSHQRCRLAHPDGIDDTMMCAGLEAGGVDACQGDSGGPLVCDFNGKWHLEGVTSFGDGCGDPGKFGVYAKVRVFMPWISARMNSSNASVPVTLSATRVTSLEPPSTASTTSTSQGCIASASQVSVSGNETSSVYPSEGQSISAALVPNALLILNTLILYFGN